VAVVLIFCWLLLLLSACPAFASGQLQQHLLPAEYMQVAASAPTAAASPQVLWLLLLQPWSWHMWLPTTMMQLGVWVPPAAEAR